MYKGETIKGLDFYRLLYESPEFCTELGKVILASGQLEAELIRLLQKREIPDKVEGRPLGRLIEIATKHKIFSEKEIYWLNELCKQRNYLMHNIYALFVEIIDETLLERSNLLESDVQTYIERVWQVNDNLIHLAEIVRKK